MVEAHFSNLRVLREFQSRVAKGKIAVLAALTLAVSLSEGIGLFLLIPFSQVISNDESAKVSGLLADLAALGTGPLLMALIAIVSVRALIVYHSNELRRGIQLDLSHRMRSETHQAIMHAEWSWLARQESADHAALIVGETERSASLFGDAATIFGATATLAILAAIAGFVSPKIALVAALLALPVIVLLLALKAGPSREAEAYWTAYSAIQSMLSNGIDRLRAARISGAQNLVESEFDKTSSSLSELERSYFRRGHRTQTIVQIVAMFALAGLVYFSVEILHAPMVLFAPILVLTIRSVPLLTQAHQAWRSWRYNKPAIERLANLIEEATANREAEGSPGDSLQFRQAIELRNISLRYDGRELPVFDDYSLKIPKGRFVAVTGPSGAGKSSLADLLSGLLLPDKGNISIDGETLSANNRASWRNQVGYLDQRPFFLTASVRDNLCWGREKVQESELLNALEQSSAEFVHAWPEGLDTMMGEGGRQLSGGELRRLALARVLLRDPELLILDEFTASLDNANASAILRAVSSLKGERTIVALSHDERVSASADEVCALGSSR